MDYQCQNFVDGQVLTAECLNRMEKGIENACKTPGPQGPKGDDGVSISHEWDGPVLKITSASGTSSANLRGPTGPIGIKGNPGKDAYEYARDGGYMGSEAKFSEQLAGIPDWDKVDTYTANDTIVIPQQSVSSGMWMNRKTDIYPGIVYAVYISGEVYFCTAHEYDGGVYLGNITLMDSSATDPHNNEPFCVYWAGGSATGGFFYKDSTLSNSVTLKVTGAAVTTENKLPEKYLPDYVAMKSDIPEGGGGANIDVVASVGQTIVVEEVDADGKPTKWKAAEFQPRTHWTEEAEILPETTVEIDPDMGFGTIVPDFTPEGDMEYVVNYNGTEYICTSFEVEGQIGFGNKAALGGNDTGEPFLCAYSADEGAMMCMPLDGSTSVTLSIKVTVVTPIPKEYIPSQAAVIDVVFDEGKTSQYITLDLTASSELANAILDNYPIYVNATTTKNGRTLQERLIGTPSVNLNAIANGELIYTSIEDYINTIVSQGLDINKIPLTLYAYSLVHETRLIININQPTSD